MFSWLLGADSPLKEELDNFADAEKSAQDQGIEHPQSPTKDRMQCAPNWDSVLDAVGKGISDAEAMGGAIDRDPADTAADAGFFGLMYGGTQFIKDSMNIQDCMDKQDQKYQEDMKDYVDKVEDIAKSKPEPIVYQYDSSHDDDWGGIDRDSPANDGGLDFCTSNSDDGPIDNCRSGRTYD